jgi:hypothetical protein
MLDIIGVKLTINLSPDYCRRSRLLRGNTIKVGVLTGFTIVLTACSVSESKTTGSSVSRTIEGLSGIPTQTYSSIKAAIPTKTATPTEKPIYTEAEIEKANIFNAETFPDMFKKIAKDPASSTDKEWQDYQVWTEALRESFFKQEGFTIDLKNIIDPENMTSLWKMLSWQENNKDKVVKENIIVLVTPEEIVNALQNYQQIVPYWEGTLFEGDGFRKYGLFGRRSKSDLSSDNPFELDLGYPFFDSDHIPGLLLNRKDSKIPRGQYFQVVGDVAGVAQARFGREDETIVFLQILDKTGKHSLFPLIFHYGKIIIPEGIYCIDISHHPAGTPFEKWPKPLALPKDFSYDGQYSPEYILDILEETISIHEISTVDDPSMEKAIKEKYNMTTMANPLHPYFDIEMGGLISRIPPNPSPKWPYDEFPYISSIPTSSQ